MAAHKSEHLELFQLVGARFNRIVVDESRIESSKELTFGATVLRREPRVSEHRSQDRVVIEIGVRLVVGPPGDEAPVVDIECTAGFISVTEVADGDLQAFQECIDVYSRGLYWILRSRTQTLFAATRLHGAHLPWDVGAFDDEAEAPTLRKKGRVKRSSRPAEPTT